jgi:hypothetical protein
MAYTPDKPKLVADRVDTLESTLRSFATLHPDNLLAEIGRLRDDR